MMTQYEFMCAVRDNVYKCKGVGGLCCSEVCSGGCPFRPPACGTGFMPIESGRKAAVDNWIKQYEEEHMTDIEKMEQKHKELMQAAQELGKQIEDMKKPKKIIFNSSKNYGLISSYGNRYILVHVNGNYAFQDICSPGSGAVGSSWVSGQAIIDFIVTDCPEHTIVELGQGSKLVINFLLGK